MHFTFEYLPASMSYGLFVEWSQVEVDLSDAYLYVPLGDKIVSNIESSIEQKKAGIQLSSEELLYASNVTTLVDRIMSAITPRIEEAAQNEFVSQTVVVQLRHDLTKYLAKTSYEKNAFAYPDVKSSSSVSVELNELSKGLPGVGANVVSPCTCTKSDFFEQKASPLKDSVWSLIQHLNDFHKEWTRERIADWLDELHDTGQVNIEFPVEVEGGE